MPRGPAGDLNRKWTETTAPHGWPPQPVALVVDWSVGHSIHSRYIYPEWRSGLGGYRILDLPLATHPPELSGPYDQPRRAMEGPFPPRAVSASLTPPGRPEVTDWVALSRTSSQILRTRLPLDELALGGAKTRAS